MTNLSELCRRDCPRCGPESLSDGHICMLCRKPLRTPPRAPARQPFNVDAARKVWSSTGSWEPEAVYNLLSDPAAQLT